MYPPGPQYGQVPPEPAARRPRGKMIGVLAVVAVVVVVAILLALNFVGFLNLGIFPGKSSTPAAGGQAMTYFQAENVANQTAATRGGSWQAGMGVAIQSSQTVNPSEDVPCAAYGYSPGSTSLPSGEAYAWGFEYLETPYTLGQEDKQLFIVVENGTGSVTTQLNAGSACPGIDYPVAGPLPSNLSNSPAVVAKFQLLGSAGFLAEYPSALLEMLVGGFYASPTSWTPIWSIQYFGTCSTVTSEQPSFGASFYGPTLGVLSHGWSNETCTPGTPASYPVTYTQSSSGKSAGGSVYFDNLTLGAPSGMTTAYFGLSILEPNKTLVTPGYIPSGCFNPPFTGCGGPPSSGGWYAILFSGGAIVGTYPNTPDSSQWNTGAPVPITSSVTLELVSVPPLSGSGDSLVTFTWSDGATVSGSTTL